VWVNYEDPALANAEISAVITSDNPIIVERAMYSDAQGLMFGAGHEGTGEFFDCFVLIGNPSDTDASVEVTFLLPNGTSVLKHYTVHAASRFNIWVDFEDPRLANTSLSTTVVSTNGVPIVVERSMWWPGSAEGWHEGHNSAGTTQSGTKWAVADGESDNDRNTETFVLIANTSPWDADVCVSVILEDGTRHERRYAVLANSRFTLPIGAVFPNARNRRYGIVVESLGDLPAQIVVERATYFDAVDRAGRRITWAAGSNAVGTKLR
jgi:hypothetical protein